MLNAFYETIQGTYKFHINGVVTTELILKRKHFD